jgi:hypothetical protein
MTRSLVELDQAQYLSFHSQRTTLPTRRALPPSGQLARPRGGKATNRCPEPATRRLEGYAGKRFREVIEVKVVRDRHGKFDLGEAGSSASRSGVILPGEINILEHGLKMDAGGRVGGARFKFEMFVCPGLVCEERLLSCSVVCILAKGSSQGARMTNEVCLPSQKHLRSRGHGVPVAPALKCFGLYTQKDFRTELEGPLRQGSFEIVAYLLLCTCGNEGLEESGWAETSMILVGRMVLATT